MAIFEARPVPNQMMQIGASAMIGIDPSATMKGCTTRETKREVPEQQADQRAEHIADDEAEQRLEAGHAWCR